MTAIRCWNGTDWKTPRYWMPNNTWQQYAGIVLQPFHNHQMNDASCVNQWSSYSDTTIVWETDRLSIHAPDPTVMAVSQAQLCAFGDPSTPGRTRSVVVRANLGLKSYITQTGSRVEINVWGRTEQIRGFTVAMPTMITDTGLIEYTSPAFDIPASSPITLIVRGQVTSSLDTTLYIDRIEVLEASSLNPVYPESAASHPAFWTWDNGNDGGWIEQRNDSGVVVPVPPTLVEPNGMDVSAIPNLLNRSWIAPAIGADQGIVPGHAYDLIGWVYAENIPTNFIFVTLTEWPSGNYVVGYDLGMVDWRLRVIGTFADIVASADSQFAIRVVSACSIIAPQILLSLGLRDITAGGATPTTPAPRALIPKYWDGANWIAQNVV